MPGVRDTPNSGKPARPTEHGRDPQTQPMASPRAILTMLSLRAARRKLDEMQEMLEETMVRRKGYNGIKQALSGLFNRVVVTVDAETQRRRRIAHIISNG